MYPIKVLDMSKTSAAQLEKLLKEGWDLKHAIFPNTTKGNSLLVLVKVK